MDRVLFQGGRVLPLEKFRAGAGAFTDGPAWVVEGNYSKLAGVTWDRSDVVIWLDHPLWFIYWRLAVRGWRRMRGTEPKSGRGWRGFFSRRNLVWTVTRKYVQKRPEYRQALGNQVPRGHLIRFRYPWQAAAWLAEGSDLSFRPVSTARLPSRFTITR
jgi:hypothetical protein